MAKVYVRDGIAAVVYNRHTTTTEPVYAGRAFDVDDPFVADHPEYFEPPVEQATAAPGEKRSTRRAS